MISETTLLNYVLVQVEEDYNSYQLKGRETNLLSPDYVYKGTDRISMPSKNFSVKGRVYAVPRKVGFYRTEIEAINRNNTMMAKNEKGDFVVLDRSLMKYVGELKNKSCRFETDNELEVGDIVKFSYMVHLTAKEKGAIFDTEHGKMYFIKYDDICMTVDEQGKPKKMINGYILVDPDVVETKKENGMEYSEYTLPTGLQLVMPTLKADSKHRRGQKCMEGKVLLSGKPLTVFDEEKGEYRSGGYFDLSGYFEVPIEVNDGDRILFDPRIAQQLEHDNHQEIADHKLYLIQRKDILFMEKDNPNFDRIGVNKVNYDRV